MCPQIDVRVPLWYRYKMYDRVPLIHIDSEIWMDIVLLILRSLDSKLSGSGGASEPRGRLL